MLKPHKHTHRAARRRSILPAVITTRCRALVPLVARMVVGVKGRPLFTRPAAVWHHLQRLRQYNSERWARQQQQRVARRQHKQRRAQGKPATSPGDSLGQRERCPGKGGAKKTDGAYASEFYAGPVIPQRPAIPGDGTIGRPRINCGGSTFLAATTLRQGRATRAAPPAATPLGVCDTQTVRHMRRGGTGGSALLRPGARWASPPLCAGAQSRGSTHPHVRYSHARKGGGVPRRPRVARQGPSRRSGALESER